MSKHERFAQYKFKFYLNASHSININGAFGEKHPHTWEISIHILKVREDFITFDILEKEIEAFLEKYQDRFLNDVEPFDTINPTLENVCNYFKNEFRNLLNKQGWMLMLIEISETPTRSYIINLLSEEKSNSDKNSDSRNIQHKNCMDTADNIAELIIKDILNS